MPHLCYNMDKLVCLEQYGSSEEKRLYSISAQSSQSDDKLTIIKQTKYNWLSATQFFRDVFLPQGYPESVSNDYLEYQIWDTIQAFSSSITGTLATQAVLQGVGVGDESASVLAATVTWVLKDGMGMLGRILFAWMKGTYLDSDCKKWRLFADILNDCAICLDILAPYYKSSFRFIVCVSGVAKSIVGVAGGATRAALTQHQARRNNMADVSAKDGSQETLVNLAALICSLVLMPIVNGNEFLIWTLFLLFTGVHLLANYKAVTAVCIEAFNQARLHLTCQSYFAKDFTQIPPVCLINKAEPVIVGLRRKIQIKLGISVENIFTSVGDLKKLVNIFGNEKYLLNINLHQGTIYIGLHTNATTRDQLKACFHAELLEYASVVSAVEESKVSTTLQRVALSLQQGDVWTALTNSYKIVTAEYEKFEIGAKGAGWNLDHVLFSTGEWRATWDVSGLDVNKEL